MAEPSTASDLHRGIIYSFGGGKGCALGHGDKETLHSPKRIPLKGNVQDIATGSNFAAALCQDGTMWLWGSGHHGRLGLGSDNDSLIPRQLPLKAQIVEIALGEWHCLARDSTGRIFAWGHNAHGSLGDGSTRNRDRPIEILSLVGKVAQLSAGSGYSAAVCLDGTLMTWGSNRDGKLGLGKDDDSYAVSEPKVVSKLAGVKVVKVNCGFIHMGCIDSNGAVYLWGKGTDGNLGHGNRLTKHSPTLVEFFSGQVTTELACSRSVKESHTAVITSDGKLYTFGSGYKGKLGHMSVWNHGMEDAELTPKLVEALADHEVVQVTGGGIHMGCVCKDGSVWTWGCGSDGRLGHPDSTHHRYLFRESLPRKVEGLDGHAVSLSCAYYVGLVLCNVAAKKSPE